MQFVIVGTLSKKVKLALEVSVNESEAVSPEFEEWIIDLHMGKGQLSTGIVKRLSHIGNRDNPNVYCGAMKTFHSRGTRHLAYPGHGADEGPEVWQAHYTEPDSGGSAHPLGKGA